MTDIKLSNMKSDYIHNTAEEQSKAFDVPEDKTEALDEIQKKLGGYGRYQIIIYFLMGIIYMRGCWHALVPIFQGIDPGYHCRPAPGLPLNESVPKYNNSDGEMVYYSCKQYVNFSLGNQTEACRRGWDYTYEDSHTEAIISEFTLTCDNSYLIELSSTMYMVGATCGVVFLAPVSERLGGKNVMLVCLWLQAIVGTIMPWAGTIAVFIMLKFFIGVFNMTIALCAAVMIHETFDATHRELPAIGIQFFWAIGIMTLALFSYLLPNWKDLQLLITLPVNIISITYIWLIPQSLPWLVSKGKLKEAARVVKRFISINNLPSIPNLDQILLTFKDKPNTCIKDSDLADSQINSRFGDSTASELSDTAKTYTILDVLKYPRLRFYVFILCYLFLINALAYFGVMFLLDGNQFLNLFYSGLVEIPAYVISMLLHKFIGRRRTICIFLFICGVSSLLVRFLPEMADGADVSDLDLALNLVQKFGITGSYSSIYLYASEIFPTEIRNQGVGFCSFFENIGSIAAPNMVYANKASTTLPLTIFAVLTIVGGFSVLFLPETHHRPLPQTIEEMEKDKK